MRRNREQKARDAALAYTKCMRENGIDMPDPDPNQRGIGLTVPEGHLAGEGDAADKACRKHLEAVKPPEMSPEQEKKFQQAALAQPRCMREHGIDMPDPTFGEDGGARIQMKGRRFDPEDPKFQKAQEACRKEAPGGLGGPSRARKPREARRHAAGVLGAAAVAAGGGAGRRRRRSGGPDAPPPPRAPPPRPSSGATSSTATASTARSATPARRRCAPARPAR